MQHILTRIGSVFRFYYEGFRDMPAWGRKVWLIILIKLFVMFAVLRLLFFPNYLGSRYDTDEEKSNHVIEQLIHKPDYYD